MTDEAAAESIVQSRLLVLQSKRLMLKSLERRLRGTGSDSFRQRADRVESEAEAAQHAYQTTVLRFASPSTVDYWLAAYKRLINMGDDAVSSLHAAAADLSAEQRYLASTEIEMLEGFIDEWIDSLRATMTGSVA